MSDESKIEEKLDELDRKYDAKLLRQSLKLAILKKIKSGDTDVMQELRRLEALESPDLEKDKETEITESDRIGIPINLRVPRHYTLSEEARNQRKEAAKAKKPKNKESQKGNKNAWKHGKFAQGYVDNFIRPCKSTCPNYPCDIVEAGNTKPGGNCMDVSALIEAYQAIAEAVKNKKLENFNDLASLTLARAFTTVNMLLEDVVRDGTIAKKEIRDAFGKLIGHEYVPHPSLFPLSKLFKELGISPAEFMITPQSIAKNKVEKKKAKTLADIFSGFGGGSDKEEIEE